ncbi:hypothetical protein [Mesorhizobium sp. NPDC059025]|uniref:DUF3592 domain-containing protein n=1 Tax=unclassified Mesorhizobium TaxID=325217 RepID=UPI0036A6927C
MAANSFWWIVPIVGSICLFFWAFKVYYLHKSMNWIGAVGQIYEISITGGGDAEVLSAIVRYEHDGNIYTTKALDPGDYDLSDKSVIGRKVPILINPRNPKQIVLTNNGGDFFNRSALMFAKFISTRSTV